MSFRGDVHRREAMFLMIRKVMMVGYCCYGLMQYFYLDSRSLQTDCTSRRKTARWKTTGRGIQPTEMIGEIQERQSARRCMFQCAMWEYRQLQGADSQLQTLKLIHLQQLAQHCHHGLCNPTTNVLHRYMPTTTAIKCHRKQDYKNQKSD